MRRSPASSASSALLGALGAISPALAESLPIVNAGFEDNSVGIPFNEFTFGPPAGWSLHDPNGITNGGAGGTYYVGTLTPFEPDPIGNPGVYANFPDGAAEGIRVAIAFNFAGSGGQGEYGLVQTLGDTLQAHTRYTLRVEIGNIASGTAMNGQFFDLDGFPGYRVDLLAGGSMIAQDLNTLAGAIAEGEFATSTVVFSSGASHAQMGQPLGIRLVNLNVVDPIDPGADLEVDFDHVRLDAVSTLDPADFNADGVVDGDDLGTLLGQWGRCAGCPADLNGDGVVDGDDLGTLLGAWS
ncbi:MAG: hypothetical protein FJ253_05260 [Phycisphaerae bacterium]|nr:hypothetical protein [Phycisphaerae bacterium]